MKKSKLLNIATYTSCGITILLGLSYILKNIILQIFIQFSLGEPAAIGIIGGADGPTAVFVATTDGLSLQKLILILTLIFGAITTILFLLKRTNKK